MTKPKTKKTSKKPAKPSMKREAPAEKPQKERIVYIPMQASGVRVTEDNSLTYSAVWGCVRIIAETLSSLAWHVLERLPDGGKEPVSNSPVDWMLHTQANPEMAAGTFRETLMANALLWGNGYAEIERDGAGRPVWLWPLPPDRVEVRRDDAGALFYRYWPSTGGAQDFHPRDIFHLKGLGFDGLVGYSVIHLAAQSIGLGIAMETNGSAFFGNGSAPQGILTFPGKASDEALEETGKNWNRRHAGPRKAHSVAVLDQGITYTPVSMSNTDSQWLEGRQFQISEIARWFRVPPHKLADLTRATFSNIEHQSIEFVTDTILPWAKRLEQEADIKLFGRALQGRYFTKLRIESLLRGDLLSRWQAYQLGLDRGVWSINEVRENEDMNGIGPDGDKRLVPLNMQLLERAGEEPVAPKTPAETSDKAEKLMRALMTVLETPEPVAPANRLNGHGVKL